MKTKTVLYTICIIGFIYLLPVLLDGLIAVSHRRWERQELYERAFNRSLATNKSLLVIGDPDTGFINYWLGRDYECGDICLDLTGCPQCNNSLKGNLEVLLPSFETGKYVVFISCTLEYLQNMANIPHLWRISYGDIYIVAIEYWAPLNWYLPGSYRIIWDYPPYQQNITWIELPEWVSYLHTAYMWTGDSSIMAGEYNSIDRTNLEKKQILNEL